LQVVQYRPGEYNALLPGRLSDLFVSLEDFGRGGNTLLLSTCKPLLFQRFKGLLPDGRVCPCRRENFDTTLNALPLSFFTVVNGAGFLMKKGWIGI